MIHRNCCSRRHLNDHSHGCLGAHRDADDAGHVPIVSDALLVLIIFVPSDPVLEQTLLEHRLIT